MHKAIIAIITILTASSAYANDCRLAIMTIIQKIDNRTYEVSMHSKKEHHLLKTYQTVYKSKGLTQIVVSKNYTEKEVLTNNGFNQIWKVYHECNNYDKQQMHVSEKESSRERLKKELKNTSLSNDEIEIWSKVGGSTSNVMAWKRFVFSPEIALEWVNSGFDLSDTQAWMRMGVESVEEAKRWKYCTGSYIINPYIAKRLIAKGNRIPEKCDKYYQHSE